MIDPKLFREYCEYLIPSDMYKYLNKATGLEKKQGSSKYNKDKLAKLMEEFKSNPTNYARKIKNK